MNPSRWHLPFLAAAAKGPADPAGSSTPEHRPQALQGLLSPCPGHRRGDTLRGVQEPRLASPGHPEGHPGGLLLALPTCLLGSGDGGDRRLQVWARAGPRARPVSPVTALLRAARHQHRLTSPGPWGHWQPMLWGCVPGAERGAGRATHCFWAWSMRLLRLVICKQHRGLTCTCARGLAGLGALTVSWLLWSGGAQTRVSDSPLAA